MSLTPSSRMLIMQDLGPFSGPPSCKSKRICATILSTRSMQATLRSGRPLGARSRTPSTTICCCRSPLLATVSDLWTPHTRSWNMQFLTNTFDGQAVQGITSVQPVPNDQQDILRWIPSKNGLCTTKNIYRYLSSQQMVQLPQQGTRSILPQANQILQRAWNSKYLPPLIKTFT